MPEQQYRTCPKCRKLLPDTAEYYIEKGPERRLTRACRKCCEWRRAWKARRKAEARAGTRGRGTSINGLEIAELRAVLNMDAPRQEYVRAGTIAEAEAMELQKA